MVMEEKILNLHFYQGKSNYLVENNIKESKRPKTDLVI